ncbi:MAG: FkbM family methyltransferase [Scytolyngbya sp. HA4215-MV1]|jgi:FkbM family methyltransferase|nr:FkbM family methyltransferase [Scytolyngbya sp. HA4215-MV1]
MWNQLFNRLVNAIDIAMRVYMRMSGYLQPIRTGKTFFGADLQCDIRDFIQRRIFFFSIYEPNLTYFIQQNLRAGDTFVDLGANIGYFSMLASQQVGTSGKVIAIEAAPDTFAQLRSNLERNGCHNVVCLNVAATKEPCWVDILCQDSKNIGCNQVTVVTQAEGKVPGKPILDILGDHAATTHFIKIDIEGAEEAVLEQIFLNLDRFPEQLTIVAEIKGASHRYLEHFRQAGFAISALPNTYRIGYLLVRHYLKQFHEAAFTVTLPVDQYSPDYTDYIFRRSTRRGAI